SRMCIKIEMSTSEKKLSHFAHSFFSGYIGQRVLLLLAPFLMPPDALQQKENLFAHIRLPYLAPTIGTTFLFTAGLVLLESLKKHGIDFTWLIQIDNWTTKIKFFLCLIVVMHAGALSRFLAGHAVKIAYQDKTIIVPPLSFWFSYYGGVALG